MHGARRAPAPPPALVLRQRGVHRLPTGPRLQRDPVRPRSTTPMWVAYAHAHGWRCHVGRVGTVERVHWARALGVDSIDSALPLWSTKKLEAFLDALADSYQLTLTRHFDNRSPT